MKRLSLLQQERIQMPANMNWQHKQNARCNKWRVEGARVKRNYFSVCVKHSQLFASLFLLCHCLCVEPNTLAYTYAYIAYTHTYNHLSGRKATKHYTKRNVHTTLVRGLLSRTGQYSVCIISRNVCAWDILSSLHVYVFFYAAREINTITATMILPVIILVVFVILFSPFLLCYCLSVPWMNENIRREREHSAENRIVFVRV